MQKYITILLILLFSSTCFAQEKTNFLTSYGEKTEEEIFYFFNIAQEKCKTKSHYQVCQRISDYKNEVNINNKHKILISIYEHEKIIDETNKILRTNNIKTKQFINQNKQ